MAYSFFVVMQNGGYKSEIGYPNMNKVSDDKFYLFEEEAVKAHQELPEEIRDAFSVVELLALSKQEYCADDIAEEERKACAKLCHDYAKQAFNNSSKNAAVELRDAILARGND